MSDAGDRGIHVRHAVRGWWGRCSSTRGGQIWWKHASREWSRVFFVGRLGQVLRRGVRSRLLSQRQVSCKNCRSAKKVDQDGGICCRRSCVPFASSTPHAHILQHIMDFAWFVSLGTILEQIAFHGGIQAFDFDRTPGNRFSSMLCFVLLRTSETQYERPDSFQTPR